jgi:regulator of replication initiation timing
MSELKAYKEKIYKILGEAGVSINPGMNCGNYSLEQIGQQIKSIIQFKNGLIDENDTLRAENELLKGAIEADTQRMLNAAEKAGVLFVDCDTPDMLADKVIELRAERDAWREIADKLADMLKNARNPDCYRMFDALEGKVERVLEEYNALKGGEDTND